MKNTSNWPIWENDKFVKSLSEPQNQSFGIKYIFQFVYIYKTRKTV